MCGLGFWVSGSVFDVFGRVGGFRILQRFVRGCIR